MKSHVIFLMLLLAPRAIVSQQAVIDTINQTVLLDREKAIEVGKIIQNEQALYEENLLLKEAVKTLGEIVANNEKQLAIYQNEVATAFEVISSLQKNIIEGSDELLRLEKKQNNFGLYGYAETGTPLPLVDYRHLMVGLKAVNKKTIFSITVNPINAKPIYAIGLGHKIF